MGCSDRPWNLIQVAIFAYQTKENQDSRCKHHSLWPIKTSRQAIVAKSKIKEQNNLEQNTVKIESGKRDLNHTTRHMYWWPNAMIDLRNGKDHKQTKNSPKKPIAFFARLGENRVLHMQSVLCLTDSCRLAH